MLTFFFNHSNYGKSPECNPCKFINSNKWAQRSSGLGGILKSMWGFSPHCHPLHPLVLKEKAQACDPDHLFISTLSFITFRSRDWPLTSTFWCRNSPQVDQRSHFLSDVTSMCVTVGGKATPGPQTTFLQVKLQIGPSTGMAAGNFSERAIKKKKKALLQNSTKCNVPPTESSFASVPPTTPFQRDTLISICSKERRPSGGTRKEHLVNSIINP